MPEQGKTFLEAKLEEIISSVLSNNDDLIIKYTLYKKQSANGIENYYRCDSSEMHSALTTIFTAANPVERKEFITKIKTNLNQNHNVKDNENLIENIIENFIFSGLFQRSWSDNNEYISCDTKKIDTVNNYKKNGHNALTELLKHANLSRKIKALDDTCEIRNASSSDYELVEKSSNSILRTLEQEEFESIRDTIKSELVEYIKRSLMYISASTTLKLSLSNDMAVLNNSLIPADLFSEIISELKNTVLDTAFINYYTYLANNITKFYDKLNNVYSIGVNDTHILGLKYSDKFAEMIIANKEQILEFYKDSKEEQSREEDSVLVDTSINLKIYDRIKKIFRKEDDELKTLETEFQQIIKKISAPDSVPYDVYTGIEHFKRIQAELNKTITDSREASQIDLLIYKLSTTNNITDPYELMALVNENHIDEIMYNDGYCFVDNFKRKLQSIDKDNLYNRIKDRILTSHKVILSRYSILEKQQKLLCQYNQELSIAVLEKEIKQSKLESKPLDLKRFFWTSNDDKTNSKVPEDKLEIFGLAHIFLKEQINEIENLFISVLLDDTKISRETDLIKQYISGKRIDKGINKVLEEIIQIINDKKNELHPTQQEEKKLLNETIKYIKLILQNIKSEKAKTPNGELLSQESINSINKMLNNLIEKISKPEHLITVNLLKNFDKLLYLNNFNFVANVERLFFTNIFENDEKSIDSNLICEVTTLGEKGLTYFENLHQTENKEVQAKFFSVQNTDSLMGITLQDTYGIDSKKHTTLIGFSKNDSNIISQTHSDFIKELNKNTEFSTKTECVLDKIRNQKLKIRYATSLGVTGDYLQDKGLFNRILEMFDKKNVNISLSKEQLQIGLSMLGAINAMEWIKRITLINDDSNFSFYNFIGEKSNIILPDDEKRLCEIKTRLLKQVYDNVLVLQRKMYNSDHAPEEQSIEYEKSLQVQDAKTFPIAGIVRPTTSEELNFLNEYINLPNNLANIKFDGSQEDINKFGKLKESFENLKKDSKAETANKMPLYVFRYLLDLADDIEKKSKESSSSTKYDFSDVKSIIKNSLLKNDGLNSYFDKIMKELEVSYKYQINDNYNYNNANLFLKKAELKLIENIKSFININGLDGILSKDEICEIVNHYIQKYNLDYRLVGDNLDLIPVRKVMSIDEINRRNYLEEEIVLSDIEKQIEVLFNENITYQNIEFTPTIESVKEQLNELVSKLIRKKRLILDNFPGDDNEKQLLTKYFDSAEKQSVVRINKRLEKILLENVVKTIISKYAKQISEYGNMYMEGQYPISEMQRILTPEQKNSIRNRTKYICQKLKIYLDGIECIIGPLQDAEKIIIRSSEINERKEFSKKINDIKSRFQNTILKILEKNNIYLIVLEDDVSSYLAISSDQNQDLIDTSEIQDLSQANESNEPKSPSMRH